MHNTLLMKLKSIKMEFWKPLFGNKGFIQTKPAENVGTCELLYNFACLKVRILKVGLFGIIKVRSDGKRMLN